MEKKFTNTDSRGRTARTDACEILEIEEEAVEKGKCVIKSISDRMSSNIAGDGRETLYSMLEMVGHLHDEKLRPTHAARGRK